MGIWSWMLGLIIFSFSHTSGNVLASQDIIFAYFLCHAPILVMNPKLKLWQWTPWIPKIKKVGTYNTTTNMSKEYKSMIEDHGNLDLRLENKNKRPWSVSAMTSSSRVKIEIHEEHSDEYFERRSQQTPMTLG